MEDDSSTPRDFVLTRENARDLVNWLSVGSDPVRLNFRYYRDLAQTTRISITLRNRVVAIMAPVPYIEALELASYDAMNEQRMKRSMVQCAEELVEHLRSPPGGRRDRTSMLGEQLTLLANRDPDAYWKTITTMLRTCTPPLRSILKAPKTTAERVEEKKASGDSGFDLAAWTRDKSEQDDS